jgi:hypothetical protein
MIFAIVRGHRSGRATPSLRDAPERQFTLTTGRGSTCRERNAVQTKPATSDSIPPEARGKPIELWWQDEARVGQQGSLTYIWAEQGTRPPAPRDQRYDSAYIFGAVCPARGVGAVVLLDGAGWHKLGGQLRVPDNMSLLRLPPYSLNPVENIWQFLRQNYLSNRVYESYDAIVDACCAAWKALIDLPERIR